MTVRVTEVLLVRVLVNSGQMITRDNRREKERERERERKKKLRPKNKLK